MTPPAPRSQHIRLTKVISLSENMKIGASAQRASAISASNPQTIIVRGHDLCAELIGRITFTDHIWLLVVGRAALAAAAPRPRCDTGGHRRARPGAERAGEPHDARRRAGIPAGGSGRGNSRLRLGDPRRFRSGGPLPCRDPRARTEAGRPSRPPRPCIQEYRAAGRQIPGYGHPLHKGRDPRVERCSRSPARRGCAGRHVELAAAHRAAAARSSSASRWR